MSNARRRSRSVQQVEGTARNGVAIYSRKSKFTDKGDSIQNQVQKCREYISRHFPDTLNENIFVYEDEGYSGATTKRPELQRMLDDVSLGKLDTVICYRLDRISRNVGDFSRIRDILEDHNVFFISEADRFDTSNPSGQAMMQMVAVFAEMERNVIKERIRDNMEELAKQGRWLGGTTPTGYKSEQYTYAQLSEGKKRKAHKLEQIPTEIDRVRLIFRKFLELGVLSQVETYLLQSGVKSKNDKDFTRFAIKSILQNPVYMIADTEAWNYFEQKEVEVYSSKEQFDGIHGIMTYNKTEQIKGKSAAYVDINDWIIAVGLHTGIISGAEWVKVQRMLVANRTKSYRKPKTTTALLSGLLFCADCGHYMRPKLSQRINADDEVIYDYLCEYKEKSKGTLCKMKRINGNVLDKAVCAEVFKLPENMNDYIHQLKRCIKQFTSQSDGVTHECKMVVQHIDTRKKEIDNLMNVLAKDGENTIFIDYAQQKVSKLHKELNVLTEKHEELKKLQLQAEERNLDIDILEETAYSFTNNFECMTIRQRCSALKMLIRRVEWDGENINIYFVGSPEGGLDFPLGREEEKATTRGSRTRF